MATAEKLSPADLDHLWEELAAGSEDARDQLVRQYEPFARYLARRAAAKAPAHQDVDDLISYAHHALLDAISKYQPGMGFKFETYATRRIAGGITDELRRADPLSRNARQRVKQLVSAQEHFWELRGRSASLEELAGYLCETVEQVSETLVMQQTLTADISEHDDLTDKTEHGSLEEAEGLEVELRDLLAANIASLPELERAFIALHYVDKISLAELGRRAQVSDVRCGQIRRKAVAALARITG